MMQLACVIQMYSNIFPINSTIRSIDIYCMQAHTRFFDRLWSMGGFLKHIATHLHGTKYNEINAFHLIVQKYVSYTESHKIFLI